MRLKYSSRAASAQAGSLFATATTCSLATGGRFLRDGRFCRALSLRRLRGPAFLLQLHFVAAPEFFEIVVAAHRRVHHMDDDVAQVHQHPFAVAPARDP